MELKRKLGLVAELGLLMITLPLVLLGCGGGGGSSSAGASTTGMMSGQFWTDLTGAGIRMFLPGFPGSPATGDVDSAVFSGGSYSTSSISMSLASGVWGVQPADPYYYLAATGWTIIPNSFHLSATNASTFTVTDPVWGAGTITVSTIDLSGQTVVASSAVPAVTSSGAASAVSPTPATYPAGSYEYVWSETLVTTTTGYELHAAPSNAVTTAASSPTPVNAANFNAAGFAAHSTTDPICFDGFMLAYKGGVTYDSYPPTPNAGVPPGAMMTCQNSHIAAGATPLGSIDLTFSTVNGVPIVTISNRTGMYAGTLYSYLTNRFVGFVPSLGVAYPGYIVLPGTSTYPLYFLNQTAMNAALQAWGVPTF